MSSRHYGYNFISRKTRGEIITRANRPGYEKANEEQQIAVSTSVGPCVTSEDKPGTIKALDEKEDEIFDMSDAELDTLLSAFDWSEFYNHAQRNINIAPEPMMLFSNAFNNCSVNICFNTK